MHKLRLSLEAVKENIAVQQKIYAVALATQY